MNQAWPVTLLASLLILSACQSHTGAPLDTQWDRSQATGHQPTCTLDSLEANPAGWKRSGSIGGVGLAENPAVDTSGIVDFGAVIQRIADLFPVADMAHDVVMVVADDYGAAHNGGTSVYTLTPSVYKLRYSDFGPSTFGADMEAELDNLVVAGELSHGAIVLTETLDMFRSLGATPVSMTPDEIGLSLGGQTVIVRALEVGGLDTAGIADALDTTIETYRSGGYERFVVNMSFTLEPCEAIDRARRDEASSYDDYLTATPPGIGAGDPLYDYIHEDHRDTVFVAAAGNYGAFGTNQPRQPGLMPEVVSVSAAFGNTKTLFANSNYGEVMAPGLWLPLTDPFGRNGFGGAADEVLLAGTSMGAPFAALASLLDLSSDEVRCGLPEGNLLAHGDYAASANMWLEEAVTTLCLP